MGLLVGMVSCFSSGKAEGRDLMPALKDLKVLVTLGGGSVMTPAFAAHTLGYSLNVESDVATVGIVAVPNAFGS